MRADLEQKMAKIILKLTIILFLFPNIAYCEENRPDVVISSFIDETSKYLKELDAKSLINLIPENFQLFDYGRIENSNYTKKIFPKKDIVLYVVAVKQLKIPIKYYFCVTNIVKESKSLKIFGYAQAHLGDGRNYFNLLSRKYSFFASIKDGVVIPDYIYSSGFQTYYTDEDPKFLHTQLKNIFFHFLSAISTNDEKK